MTSKTSLVPKQTVTNVILAQDGSIGTMTKESAGETVTVRFDTNGTMPKTEDQDALEDAGREVLW